MPKQQNTIMADPTSKAIRGHSSNNAEQANTLLTQLNVSISKVHTNFQIPFNIFKVIVLTQLNVSLRHSNLVLYTQGNNRLLQIANEDCIDDVEVRCAPKSAARRMERKRRRGRYSQWFSERIFSVQIFSMDNASLEDPSSSPTKLELYALNLLRLLIVNKLTEFHLELELLTFEERQSTVVAYVVGLEQALAEGSYHKFYPRRYKFHTNHLLC